VEFRRISLTGFRSCASRSQIEASQSRQSTDCHKFDSWKNLTSHLPRACLMLALAGFPSSLRCRKASVKEITVPNEETDPALGFLNPASKCHTCGAKDYRTCEESDVRCKHIHRSYSDGPELVRNSSRISARICGSKVCKAF
nr:DNA-directed RNA polymerase IV subunit 1 isoform X1 [Tanacetum cinerariifolium]